MTLTRALVAVATSLSTAANVLLCNGHGHYAGGMVVDLNVS